MTSFHFVFRYVVRIAVFAAILAAIWEETIGAGPDWLPGLLVTGTILWSTVRAISHVRRVQLIAPRYEMAALANRHRRQIEIPFPADEAFSIVDAAIRELPHVDTVESAADSLQVRARVLQGDPYALDRRPPPEGKDKRRRNLVLATITPGARTGSLTLVCQPEGSPWRDWFRLDDGTNLENAEAISRAISRRVGERRQGEEAATRETAAEKELTVAKLSLLQAQVEPHFLYNTLASAQLLTRSDPARADQMLGHLIQYLRSSVPRAEEAMSTLGEELTRVRAYLEILRIRMGERLQLDIQVPEALRSVPLPPMMLQTLVENAIKHGLEPVPGGGTIWILARASGGTVSITVADDGRGFGSETNGTGIGLRNVRERLRLAYGEAASFNIAANFPRGVGATITVPQDAMTPSPALPQGGGSSMTPSPALPQGKEPVSSMTPSPTLPQGKEPVSSMTPSPTLPQGGGSQ